MFVDAEPRDSESEDELRDLVDPAYIDQHAAANIGEEQAPYKPRAVNPLWESMGNSKRRQSKDPAPSTLFPRLHGAGLKYSCRTRVWRGIRKQMAVDMTFEAMALLVHAGGGFMQDDDGVDQFAIELGDPPVWREDKLHKQLLFFHFKSCRISDAFVLSSELRDRQLQAARRDNQDYVSASSFALAKLPEDKVGLRAAEEHTCVPVHVIAYAGIVWDCEKELQRVAYVKVLPYVRLEVCAGNGQFCYDVPAQEVATWDRGSERVFCLPLDHLLKPLMVVEPEGGDLLVPELRLIEFGGKRLGS